MPTLAPKLPWQHAFAGGYPGRSGQALPTDADAIDYLNRVAAADGGAAVEVGIAQAIDAFVRGCKADSAGYAGDPTRTNWDAIQAACIMCGARTISGALVPLKGTAPTPQGSWASGDYSRAGATPGLKGNGVDKYIDTNRANNADGQNDNHLATYATQGATVNSYFAGAINSTTPASYTLTGFEQFNRSGNGPAASSPTQTGLYATSRMDSSEYAWRARGASGTAISPSITPAGLLANNYVFAYSGSSGQVGFPTNARLAFYSIGSACDLSLLDARVTSLVRGIQFAQYTGLSPADYDDATVAYIVAAYIAGGAL